MIECFFQELDNNLLFRVIILSMTFPVWNLEKNNVEMNGNGPCEIQRKCCLVDLSQFSSTKIITQAKIDNFAFKNSNIIIEGYSEREKVILHEKNLKHKKIILLINFIFDPTFFLIAFYQILKNYAILINHESFFQRKDFPQLHRF